MSDHYYNRKRNADGSFGNSDDKQKERFVKKLIASIWNIEIFEYPQFNPVDWFFVQNGRLYGYGEYKYRNHSVNKYDTVFLSMRKCESLFRYGLLSDVPSFYIIQWKDDLRSIDVMSMSRNQIILGGCKKNMKSPVDKYEPIITVDIDHMSPIKNDIG